MSHNGTYTLTGIEPGDEVTVFNQLGQMVTSFKASSATEEFVAKDAAIVQVRSRNSFTNVKVR